MKSITCLLAVMLGMFSVSSAQDKKANSQRLLPIVIGGRTAYINLNGNVVLTPEMNGRPMYSEGLAAVQIDGKWCYVDQNKIVVIKTDFEEVSDFQGGLAMVKKTVKRLKARPDEPGSDTVNEEKIGFIDKKGKVVFKPQFDEFYGFNEGLGRIVIDDKWGFIDMKGHIVIPPKFDGAYWFSEGLANVTLENDDDAYIDRTGRIVYGPSEVSLGSWFSSGLVSVNDGIKSGFMDKNFKLVIPLQFEGVGAAFSEGLVAVKVGELWGYIDTSGKIVIKPQFKYQPDSFSEGLAAVTLDRRIGYIGRDGSFVIPPQFTQAQDFYGGVAAVTSKVSTAHVNVWNRWDYIDRNGRYIWRSE